MRTDSYTQPNTTHWVQCANRRENCPVFPGDTRITVIHVPDLLPDQEIPKEKLIEKLTEEAPHFMYTPDEHGTAGGRRVGCGSPS